jgi:hypothetical protein
MAKMESTTSKRRRAAKDFFPSSLPGTEYIFFIQITDLAYTAIIIVFVYIFANLLKKVTFIMVERHKSLKRVKRAFRPRTRRNGGWVFRYARFGNGEIDFLCIFAKYNQHGYVGKNTYNQQFSPHNDLCGAAIGVDFAKWQSDSRPMVGKAWI